MAASWCSCFSMQGSGRRKGAQSGWLSYHADVEKLEAALATALMNMMRGDAPKESLVGRFSALVHAQQRVTDVPPRDVSVLAHQLCVAAWDAARAQEGSPLRQGSGTKLKGMSVVSHVEADEAVVDGNEEEDENEVEVASSRGVPHLLGPPKARALPPLRRERDSAALKSGNLIDEPTVQLLGERLCEFGVDIKRFGEGPAKGLKELKAEVDKKETRLQVGFENDRQVVYRRTMLLSVALLHADKVLIEKQRIKGDGRIEVRGTQTGHNGTEILRRINWNIEQAPEEREREYLDFASEALLRELPGLSSDHFRLPTRPIFRRESAPDSSPKYPGLVTIYTEIHVEAKVLYDLLDPELRKSLGLVSERQAVAFHLTGNKEGSSETRLFEWVPRFAWSQIATFSDVGSLREFLTKLDIDTSIYGQGRTKSLPDLLKELHSGATRLLDHSIAELRSTLKASYGPLFEEAEALREAGHDAKGQAVALALSLLQRVEEPGLGPGTVRAAERRVKTLEVLASHGQWMLVETHRLLPDGRVKMLGEQSQGMPLITKVQPSEDHDDGWRQCALRVLSEDLSLPRNAVRLGDGRSTWTDMEVPTVSSSYPEMFTVYERVHTEAQIATEHMSAADLSRIGLSNDQPTSFAIDEVREDGTVTRHFWTWMLRSTWRQQVSAAPAKESASQTDKHEDTPLDDASNPEKAAHLSMVVQGNQQVHELLFHLSRGAASRDEKFARDERYTRLATALATHLRELVSKTLEAREQLKSSGGTPAAERTADGSTPIARVKLRTLGGGYASAFVFTATVLRGSLRSKIRLAKSSTVRDQLLAASRLGERGCEVKGHVCLRFVGKFDLWDLVMQEGKKMRDYSALVGDAEKVIPQMLTPVPHKVSFVGPFAREANATELGILAMELVGSNWLLPEFSVLGGAAVSTLGELFLSELQLEARSFAPHQSELPDKRLVNGQCSKVLSDELFSSTPLGAVSDDESAQSSQKGGYRGILTSVIHSSGKRAATGWAEPTCAKLLKRMREARHDQVGGWCQEKWFLEGRDLCASAKQRLDVYVPALVAELSAAFGTGACGLGGKMGVCITSNDTRPSTPRSTEAAQVWAAPVSGASLDLEPLLGGSTLLLPPPEWVSSWTPLVATAHGDLRAANILIDLRGAAWLIDFGEVTNGQLCLTDLTRLLASLLFEETSIESHGELEAACELTKELFSFRSEECADLRDLQQPIVDDERYPRLGVACDAALRLLQAVPGLLLAAGHAVEAGGVVAADFHPLAFQLTMLERTLRMLTYHEEQLTPMQRRWALYSASELSEALYRNLEQPPSLALPQASGPKEAITGGLAASRPASARPMSTALTKYLTYIETVHTTIFDAITGQRLHIEEHCADTMLRVHERDKSTLRAIASDTAGTVLMNATGLLVWLLRSEPAPELRATPLSLDLALPDEPRVIVTGLSGSGKSVLLKRLASSCARWHVHSEQSVVPLYIDASDLASLMADQPALMARRCRPETVVHAFIRRRHDGTQYQLLRRALKDGKLLLLLDQLGSSDDSISGDSDAVVAAVEAFASSYRGRLVVATRPGGFRESRFRQFVGLEIEPLSPMQIRNVAMARGANAKVLHAAEQSQLCAKPIMLAMLLAMLDADITTGTSVPLYSIYSCCVRVLLLRLNDSEQLLLERAVYHAVCGMQQGNADTYEAKLPFDLIEETIREGANAPELQELCLPAVWDGLRRKTARGLVAGLVLHSGPPCHLIVTLDALMKELFVSELLRRLKAATDSDKVPEVLRAVLPEWPLLLSSHWWEGPLQLCIEKRQPGGPGATAGCEQYFTSELMQIIRADPNYSSSHAAASSLLKNRGGALLFADLLRLGLDQDAELFLMSAEPKSLGETLSRALLDEHLGASSWHKYVTPPYQQEGGVSDDRPPPLRCQICARLVKAMPHLKVAKGRDGNTAYDRMHPDIKQKVDEALTFCGWLDITSTAPEHKSERTVVLLGRAVKNPLAERADERALSDEQRIHEGDMLALKLMRSADAMEDEMRHRKGQLGRGDAVLPVLLSSSKDAELAQRFAEDVKDINGTSYAGFTCGIVMRAAQRSLMAILIHEEVTLDGSVYILNSLVRCVKKMHETGKVHGDLKPRNVVRMADGQFRLIDLGSTASMGEPLKLSSTAYAPPEMLTWSLMEQRKSIQTLEQARRQRTSKRFSQSGEGAEAKANSGAPPASASFDMWSYGVLLFRLLARKPLFDADDSDNMLPEQVKRVVMWSPAALGHAVAELSHAMLLHELRAGGDRRTAKQAQWRRIAAVDLLSWLLSALPDNRPMMFDVHLHAFFCIEGSNLMGATWRQGPLHVAAALGYQPTVLRLLATNQATSYDRPAPSFKSEDGLLAWLLEHGIGADVDGKLPALGDKAHWWSDSLKTLGVHSLFQELQDGTCGLYLRRAEDGSTAVLRRVRTVCVMLQLKHHDKSYVLAHGETGDGAVPSGQSMPVDFVTLGSVTLKLRERWVEGAARAYTKLIEGSGLQLRDKHVSRPWALDENFFVSDREESSHSASCQGLRTISTVIYVSAHVKVENHLEELRKELGIDRKGQMSAFKVKSASGKARTFVWRPISSSQLAPQLFASEEALGQWLKEHGVNVGNFRKPLKELLQEVHHGTSLSAEENGSGGWLITRRIKTVQVSLLLEREGHKESWTLVHKRTIEGGNIEVRGRETGGQGHEPLDKMRTGEVWQDTANRCILEVSEQLQFELQNESPRRVNVVAESESYPGLRTENTCLMVIAKLQERGMADNVCSSVGLKAGMRPTPFVTTKLSKEQRENIDGGSEQVIVKRHCWAWEETERWRSIIDRQDTLQRKHPLGLTPLHLAAMEGHDGVVRTLLDKEFNIDSDAVSDVGDTALHTVLRRIEQMPPTTTRRAAAFVDKLVGVVRMLANVSNLSKRSLLDDSTAAEIAARCALSHGVHIIFNGLRAEMH